MTPINRKSTRQINIGGTKIGGNNPILIQSMTNTDTRDISATVSQIKALEEAGCEIVRFAVKDMEAAEAIKEIKKQTSIPLVADIHFDYRLAIESMKNGIDKLRINPGNIGERARVKEVAVMAKERDIPIRIGVNSGSVEKRLLEKYGGVTAEGLVESAMHHVQILEEMNFFNIVISLKGSGVHLTCRAYQLLSEQTDYPLHVGITEAGTQYSGTIKSAAGIGAILLSGLGDTIRVSLTANPVEEIRCGREILKALEIRSFGPTIISCPTCGRTEIDLIGLASEVEKRAAKTDRNIKIAVMGCEVNGPGEAREADIGIAGGKGCGLLFKKGEIIGRYAENKLLDALFAEINKGI